MKKILLLSDTHSYIDDQILKFVKQADEVWHAGDIGSLDIYDKLNEISKVKAVYGNIDNHQIRITLASEVFFKCEGLNIYMTHIGGYPGKYSKAVKEKIEKTKPDIFICGHSHILKVMNDKINNLLFINPGAAGNHGIHQVKTIVQFIINEKKISDLKIIELKR